MRTVLSRLISQAAVKDPDILVLSGDHGYALFDEVRRERPGQFINVGVAEQAMIGMAAGLCREGYRPIVYGLAAFVPIRVLEQIKLDLCISQLPVILLGDGAGLVYSTLGASHQCGEDLAALRPMPGLHIYSPGDAFELEICFREARANTGPSYIRIGKSDRPPVHMSVPSTSDAVFTHHSPSPICLVATGSMAITAKTLAIKHHWNSISVMKMKPFEEDLIGHLVSRFQTVFVLEEHSRYGGLFSSLAEWSAQNARLHILPISMADQFAEACGQHSYALSEHGLTDEQIEAKILSRL